MNKKIFNILLVCLVIFIAVYFSLKISNYGDKLKAADDQLYNNTRTQISYKLDI